MKKYILSGIVFLFFSQLTFSQKKCVIDDCFQEIFKTRLLDYEGKQFFSSYVDSIPSHSCYASWVNSNLLYFDYILNHFSDHSNNNKYVELGDSAKIHDAYIKSLLEDSTFYEIIKFNERKLADSDFIPDTVTIDELINVAVKFFAIIMVNNDGNYIGKICVGFNIIEDTEETRNPYLEAFCFQSIFNHYMDEEYHMYNEFVKGIKELYKLNLGIEKEDRLLRAQGAMFMFMRNNQILKEMLLHEFGLKKDSLPFVVIDA